MTLETALAITGIRENELEIVNVPALQEVIENEERIAVGPCASDRKWARRNADAYKTILQHVTGGNYETI